MDVFRLIQTISIGAILSACASSSDPVFYVLDSASPSSDPGAGDTLISLAEVRLPSYARDQKITSLDGQNRVIKDGNHRWASPPEEAVTSKLAVALEAETSARVLVRPIPSGLVSDYTLTVTLDDLLRGEAGEAIVGGQYIIVGDDSVAYVERFTFTIQAGGRTYAGFMRGVSAALEKLSQQIDNDLDHLKNQTNE